MTFDFDLQSIFDSYETSLAFLDDPNPQIPFIPSPSIDSSNTPYSPPTHEIHSLSLNPTPHSPPPSTPVLPQVDQIPDLGVLDRLTLDEFSTDLNSPIPSLPPYNLNQANMMQMSFSSLTLEQTPNFVSNPNLLYSPLESPNFMTQMPDLVESSRFDGIMRRVCSTGDISVGNTIQSRSCTDEWGIKSDHYNAEERKLSVQKYRSKRNQRNFNKTIKYACRKTLADNRVRVRGRFARNDETGEIGNATTASNREEEEGELWVDGFYNNEEEMMARGGFANRASPCFQ
ncbi:uncharacterized protein LOC143887406 [Tasmannia lanceolata]|uniref:uncharacterized protein LOC143887406 n=1 Tax=Tasmannia lanceolata TaxID=3420 RepID=UPI0040649C58